MSRNLKTMICCILALVFVSGTVIAVLAESGNLYAVEPESVSEEISEEASEEVSEDVSDETTTEKEEPTYVYGDVNGDGEVTAADARMILRVSAQLDTFNAAQTIAADVVKDGKILANDARRVLRLSAQLISPDELVSEVA